jgi:hypothetical protein
MLFNVFATDDFTDGKLSNENIETSNEIVEEFLEEHYYPHFTKNFERITEKDKQVIGIDCTFTIKNYDYICDEKAACGWANKNLQTFSLELTYINRAKKLHKGWYLDNTHVSNSFNLVYTDVIRDNEGDFSYYTFEKEHIKELTSILVRKEKLNEYLNSIGWTKEKLLEKAKEIRETNGNCEMGKKDIDEVRFYYCKNLPELPTNILIKREKLLELSDLTFIYNRGVIEFYSGGKRIKTIKEK